MRMKINFLWDQEAGVWVATSDDIRGLVMESESLDKLIERIKLAVPDLMEGNHQAPPDGQFLYRAELIF